jgi:glycosyltransferase involved in cell wall biosynthesis
MAVMAPHSATGAASSGDLPFLSVVVPFFRAERYIQRCLTALVRQSYPAGRFEILLVDNNSPDGSSQIVEQYPGLKLLHEPTQSAYAARNRGSREAAGDIVVFTDADCVAHHDWLGQLAEVMRDPQVQIVVGPTRPGDGSQLVELVGLYEDSKERYILGGDEPSLYVGHAGNMAVRKAILDEFGPFLEHDRGSDTTLVRRVVDSRSCGVVRYEPSAEVRHLEVARLRDYFRKVFLYGRSWGQHRLVNGTRPLSRDERLQVFRTTVQRNGLSRREAARLLAALLIGAACWGAGVAVGRCGPAFRRLEARPWREPLGDEA